ncbi:porin family protein [Mucilaginibacter paludis]|uniref:Outer membrane protein beta-barrel domain-containing protein n=1 Tax=Mucilaginibacter paludis DSM 18603 TaxID=714943 RepID=H1Y6P1_9SPHI|nr:porin family protein [Mucilaginibacter paludis]EHQ26833.1 hypothetical protein Mucpa_2721 [Mucilaginibacter paludis DSM 18603]
MKKILSTLIIAVTFCTTAFSQTQSKGIEAGINIGYSSSTAISNNATNSTYKTGFNAGLSAENYFSDRWGLKVKVIYDQKGWKEGYITDYNGHLVFTDYNLDYVTVPVMANWHFGRTRNWYLNFGPYIGFLVNAKAPGANLDLKDYINSTDAGLALGIGIKFKIAEKTKLFIDYDAQAGATDIIKNNTGSSISLSRASFNVGLNF